MPLPFEWDPRKAKNNLAKHGLSFEAVTAVFGYRFEVQSLDHITHRALREHIQRVGIIVYPEAGLSSP